MAVGKLSLDLIHIMAEKKHHTKNLRHLVYSV